MGRTLAELRTDVQLLGFTSTSNTLIDAALNAAQRRVAGMRRWRFLQENATVALSAADVEVLLSDVASDCTHIESIRLFNSDGDELHFEYVDPGEWRRLKQQLQDDTGPPEYWTLYGETIRIAPIPDVAYSLEVDYIREPAALVNTSDISDIPSNYSDVLVGAAASWLGMRLRDDSMVQMGEVLFARTVQAMLAGGALVQRQNATSVPRSAHWSTYEWGKDWPIYS